MNVLALWLAGCEPDAWDRYELYFQVDGISSFENGPAVCQVATSARHVVFVTGDGSIGNQCWADGDPRFLSFGRIVPASMLVRQTTDVPADFYPVHVDGEGPDLVALDARNGVAWWAAEAFTPAEDVADHDIPQLRGVVRPPYDGLGSYVDLAVSGGVAWVIEARQDGGGLLHRIDLEAAMQGEDAVSTASLAGAPVSVDVIADGGVVVTTESLSTYDVDGEPIGSVPLLVPPDGMKVGGDVAWVSGDRRIFGLDLSDEAAPTYVDEEGTPDVDEASVVLHAQDTMFFTSSGLDSVAMAWDGSSPERPKAVGGFHAGNGTFDIDTAGQVLLLATGTHGLQLWGPHRDWDCGGTPC